jgi:hypothetical protein
MTDGSVRRLTGADPRLPRILHAIVACAGLAGAEWCSS